MAIGATNPEDTGRPVEACLLFGGGYDSASILILRHQDIKVLVFVDYGQRDVVEERDYLDMMAESYEKPRIVLSAPDWGRMYQTHPMFVGGKTQKHDELTLVGRNMMLVSMALPVAHVMGCSHIFLGITENTAPLDTKKPYLEILKQLVKAGDGDVQLDAPFYSDSRDRVFQRAFREDPLIDFAHTTSPRVVDFDKLNDADLSELP